ncbi:OsmC family protein [Adhaeribacter terreus]|uniref:OsmC family protein n=1 Tax=Adhaeribacter terreus TaxID=529703 RepID=A0ABW0EFV9_9BACT
MKNEQKSAITTTNQVRAEVGENSLQASIQAGKHEMIADEPESLGGKDTGPEPFDYLLSALAACTTITLRMYADRKDWPVSMINAVVSLLKEEAGDAVELEKNPVKKLQTNITVTGNLTDDQVLRLLEIAKKCPVHKAILPAFKIVTEIRLAQPK